MNENKKPAATVEGKSNPEMDAYIAEWPPEIQDILVKTRELIHATVPGVTEHISWGMPTFKRQGKNLFHFAANKAHLGIYPGPEVIESLQTELAAYKTTKGAVQFLYKEEIPYALIQKIVLLSKDHLDRDLEARAEAKRKK